MSSKAKRNGPSGAAATVGSATVELASPSSPPNAVPASAHPPRQSTESRPQIAKPKKKAVPSPPSPSISLKRDRADGAPTVAPPPTLPHMPTPLASSNPASTTPARSSSPSSSLFSSFCLALSKSDESGSSILFRQLKETGRVTLPALERSTTSGRTDTRPDAKVKDEKLKAKQREREVDLVKKRSEAALKVRAAKEAARPKPPVKPIESDNEFMPGLVLAKPAKSPTPTKKSSVTRPKTVLEPKAPLRKGVQAGKGAAVKAAPDPVALDTDTDTDVDGLPDLVPIRPSSEARTSQTVSDLSGSAVSSESAPTRPTTPSSPPQSLYQMAEAHRRQEERTQDLARQTAADKVQAKPIEIAQGRMVAVAVAVAAASSPSPAPSVSMSKPSALKPTDNAEGSPSSASSVASSVPPVTPTHLPKKPPPSCHPVPSPQPSFAHPPNPRRPSQTPARPSNPAAPRFSPPPEAEIGQARGPVAQSGPRVAPIASSSFLPHPRPPPPPSSDHKGKGREQADSGSVSGTHFHPHAPARPDGHARPAPPFHHNVTGTRPTGPVAVGVGSRPAPRPPEPATSRNQILFPADGSAFEPLHGPARFDQPSPTYPSSEKLPPWRVSDWVRPKNHEEMAKERDLATAARMQRLRANAGLPQPGTAPPHTLTGNGLPVPVIPRDTAVTVTIPPVQSWSRSPPPILPSQRDLLPRTVPGGHHAQPTARSPPSGSTRNLPAHASVGHPPRSHPAPQHAPRLSPLKPVDVPLPRPAPVPVPPPPAPKASAPSPPPPPPRSFTPTYATPSSRDSGMRATDFLLQEKPQGSVAEIRAKHAHRAGSSDHPLRREAAELAAFQVSSRWVPPDHARSGPGAEVLDEELALLGLGRHSGRKTNFTAECFVHVESSYAFSSRVELEIDRRELELLCEFTFGPVHSVQLLPHHLRAFVKFKFVADAMKAMQASLPVSEKGEGGALFGEGKRFVFEPRKRAVLAMYREDDDGEEWSDLVGRDDGGRAAWRRNREEQAAGQKSRVDDFIGAGGGGGEDRADYECSICLQLLSNPHLLPCCGHTFCLSCIDRLASSLPKKCPHCRESLDKAGKPVPNRFAKTAVERFIALHCA